MGTTTSSPEQFDDLSILGWEKHDLGNDFFGTRTFEFSRNGQRPLKVSFRPVYGKENVYEMLIEQDGKRTQLTGSFPLFAPFLNHRYNRMLHSTEGPTTAAPVLHYPETEPTTLVLSQ